MPTIEVAGIPIHYETAGDDRAGRARAALVLVHGSGGSTVVWRHQLEGLADVARVVALDLPGHGRSGGAPPATIDESVGVVRALVDALELGAVVIGGHSMGGAVAQAFALAHPERCAGLALIGTGARLRVLPKLLDLLERDGAEGARLLTDLALAAGAPAALKDEVYRLTLAAPRGSVVADLRACDAFDVRARLDAIGVPAIAITGAEDQLTPPRYAEFLRDHIRGARVVLVPGSGHYVQLERPAETTAALRGLLLGLPERRSQSR